MKALTLFVVSFAITLSSSFAQISLIPKWESDASFKVPESVIYDEENNILYVANINGDATQKDGNGFISKLAVDGKIDNLNWIKGLDGPKGMGIYKSKLYVADISKLVIIDIKSSSIENSIEIADAQFLNDISIDDKGNVYISDSFNKKVYKYANGKIETWIDNAVVQKPNGLLAEKKTIKLMDFNTGVLYDINYKTKALSPIAKDFPEGGDGIVKLSENEYIISFWPGLIYHIKNDTKTKLLDTKEQKVNAADIWYVKKLNLLFVPTFFDNKVVAYKIENSK